MRPKMFFLFPLIFLLAPLLVMTLWNHVLVDVASVSKINFAQAIGLLILSRILFGRIGGSPFYATRKCRFGPPPHIRERWMKMSDEERANLRDEWRKRSSPPSGR